MIRKVFPIVVALYLAACAQAPASESRANLPAARSGGVPLAKSQEEADFLDQRFDFFMEATLKEFDVSTLAGGVGANLYPAIMNSTWRGEFSIDPDGSMNGQGKLVTEATVFNVAEDWCGYAFTELAEHEFTIKGQLKQVGDKYYLPLKIWDVTLITPNPPLGPPEATCADPNPRFADPAGAQLIIGPHRTAMINLVMQHFHQEVGDQIVLGVPLEVESGKVEYKIEISLPAVDLVE